MPGFLGAFVAIALGFVLAESTRLSRGVAAEDAVARGRYLQEAASKVEAWYAAHAADVDGELPPPARPDEAWLSGIGISRRYRLHVQWTEMLESGPLRFRRAVLWLPGVEAADAVRVDPRSGAVSTDVPGVLVQVVDGARIEGKAYAASLALLRGLARDLELRARAVQTWDPEHRADLNPFRPRDPACRSEPDEPPCSDGFQEARSMGFWRTGLGRDPQGLVAPWGRQFPVLFRNPPPAAEGDPYTAWLRVFTPWHTPLDVAAVQPLS